MPLHCACWKGQLEAIEFLLSHGAQTFECDVSLKTALHWAVQYDHFNALHTLLKVHLSIIFVLILIFHWKIRYVTVTLNENKFLAVACFSLSSTPRTCSISQIFLVLDWPTFDVLVIILRSLFQNSRQLCTNELMFNIMSC